MAATTSTLFYVKNECRFYEVGRVKSGDMLWIGNGTSSIFHGNMESYKEVRNIEHHVERSKYL